MSESSTSAFQNATERRVIGGITSTKESAVESLNKGLNVETSDNNCISNNIDMEANGNGDSNAIASETATAANVARAASEQPYSVFSIWQKRAIVLAATAAATFSRFTAQIYFPALNTISKELNITSSQINLTITTYMACASIIKFGIAPSLTGAISDAWGRRPSYIICFTIYIIANIGLALQNNYAALLVLRCLQSSGSSGTIAIVSAVVVDVAPSAERGTWIGYTSLAAIVGPSVGPPVGGVFSRYLGWKSVFWFLVIAAAVFFVPMLLFYPETARNIVGNGSVPPPKWNRPLSRFIMDAIRKQRRKQPASNSPTGSSNDSAGSPTTVPATGKRGNINPLGTLTILSDKETAIILIYSSILFAGFYAVMTSVPSQFAKLYNFNDVELGLVFIPIGCGSIASITNGRLMDYNFRRYAKKLNMPVVKNRQQDLFNFPIEKVRLQIGIPFLYLAAVSTTIYGWILHIKAHVAVPIILLFVMGYAMLAGFNSMSVLVVDIHRDQPATATAANNLTRCSVGAAMTALIGPIIDGIGTGWTFTLIGVLYATLSPMLWAVIKWGMTWRQERIEKENKKWQDKELRIT